MLGRALILQITVLGLYYHMLAVFHQAKASKISNVSLLSQKWVVIGTGFSESELALKKSKLFFFQWRSDQ